MLDSSLNLFVLPFRSPWYGDYNTVGRGIVGVHQLMFLWGNWISWNELDRRCVKLSLITMHFGCRIPFVCEREQLLLGSIFSNLWMPKTRPLKHGPTFILIVPIYHKSEATRESTSYAITVNCTKEFISSHNSLPQQSLSGRHEGTELGGRCR